MPMVRRCPRCGDDLSPEESVCVFCGHAIGRAGLWERIRLRAEDWTRLGALVVVSYVIGLDVILWLIGWVAPAVAAAVYADPSLDRGLRIALALAAVAGSAAPMARAARRARPASRP